MTQFVLTRFPTQSLLALAFLLSFQATASAQTNQESNASKPDAEEDPTSTNPAQKTQQVVIQPGQIVNGFSLEALSKRGITWDLTPSAAIRLARGESDSKVFQVRLRAGVMVYKEPTFIIAGVAAQYGGIADGLAIGGEVEVLQVARGMWAQAGAYGDSSGAILGLSVGYTLFGIEYQKRLSGPDEGMYSVMLGLHIPVGVIRVALQPISVARKAP